MTTQDFALALGSVDRMGGDSGPMPVPTDALAVSRGCEVLSAVFTRDYGALCALAAAMTGDRSLAEDLVMDAFVRTFGRLHALRDPEAAGVYVRRAVLNRVHDAHRRRLIEDRANREHHSSQESDVGLPDRDYDLASAIGSLPPRQQLAIVLRYFDDLPEHEVARHLGCSLGTVKSQLAKARRNLARDIGHERETR
ncbi:MAG: RNA polymerase sigma factor [Mycobacteriales bacterium]